MVQDDWLIKLGNYKPWPSQEKIIKSFYVKDGDKVKKVSFGDTTGLSIKRDNPARRKSFRARFNCDNPGPRYKARYWSCRKW